MKITVRNLKHRHAPCIRYRVVRHIVRDEAPSFRLACRAAVRRLHDYDWMYRDAGQPRSERKRFASILRSGYLIQGSDGKVWINVAQIEAQP